MDLADLNRLANTPPRRTVFSDALAAKSIAAAQQSAAGTAFAGLNISQLVVVATAGCVALAAAGFFLLSDKPVGDPIIAQAPSVQASNTSNSSHAPSVIATVPALHPALPTAPNSLDATPDSRSAPPSTSSSPRHTFKVTPSAEPSDDYGWRSARDPEPSSSVTDRDASSDPSDYGLETSNPPVPPPTNGGLLPHPSQPPTNGGLLPSPTPSKPKPSIDYCQLASGNGTESNSER